MGPRRVAIGCLILVVLLAGCTFGVSDGEPMAPMADPVEADAADPTAPAEEHHESDDELVPLEDHQLDINHTEVFERVTAMVDHEVPIPPVNVIEPADLDTMNDHQQAFPFMPEGFTAQYGLDETGAEPAEPLGFADGLGNVFLVNVSTDEAFMEQVLVHEYTHTIQFRGGLLPWQTPVAGEPTTDAWLSRLAVIEGGADYVTDEYTAEYLDDESVQTRADQLNESFHAAAVGDRFHLSPYYYGLEYATAQLERPAALDTLYDPAPNSTTHILHNLDPAVNPRLDLAVQGQGDGNWTATDEHGTDRLGELTTVMILSGELSVATAESAAAGWAEDRVLEFERNHQTGYAWVHRWNDAANATEFAGTFEEFAANRTTSDQTFDLRWVGNQTTVILSGPSQFVDQVTVSGEPERVAVGVDTAQLDRLVPLNVVGGQSGTPAPVRS